MEHPIRTLQKNIATKPKLVHLHRRGGWEWKVQICYLHIPYEDPSL